MSGESSLGVAVSTLSAHHATVAGPVSGRGLEALIAGATLGVSKKTWLLPGRRERACALVRGCPADQLDAARPWRTVPPGDAPVARALAGVGMAMAGEPALVFLGTGSVSYGAFAEALSAAVLQKAPVTFVVGWYVTEGPFAQQLAVSPSALAQAVGLAAASVDGSDAEAVRAAVAGVAGGPALVECRLFGRG